jgi:hypothetical protein
VAIVLRMSSLANSTSAFTEPQQVQVAPVTAISRKKKRIIKVVRGAAGISKKMNGVIPTNGLSSIEQYFHYMPQHSSQVILTYCGRICLPEKADFLSVDRILDICKITAAQVYRTSSVLDFESQTFKPMGSTAADISIRNKFTEYENEDTVRKIAEMEINQQYDLKEELPLWSMHIVGPKEMLAGITRIDGESLPKFYLFCSIHHCIGDGLSGFAFFRILMSKMKSSAFKKDPIDLKEFAITTVAPPILDNYINPSIIGIIPGNCILEV